MRRVLLAEFAVLFELESLFVPFVLVGIVGDAMAFAALELDEIFL